MSENKLWAIGWTGLFLFLTIPITAGIALGVQNNNHMNDLKKEKFVSCINAGNKPLECAVEQVAAMTLAMEDADGIATLKTIAQATS